MALRVRGRIVCGRRLLGVLVRRRRGRARRARVQAASCMLHSYLSIDVSASVRREPARGAHEFSTHAHRLTAGASAGCAPLAHGAHTGLCKRDGASDGVQRQVREVGVEGIGARGRSFALGRRARGAHLSISGVQPEREDGARGRRGAC
jgi:hypothetical protein